MARLALDNGSQPWGETLASMRSEGRSRLVPLALLFALVAVAALALGWNWPKKYHAAATVLVSEDKIIQKLMEGRAVPTGVAQRALIAHEIVFSRAVMDGALKLGGWLDDAPSAAERELRSDAIKSRTLIGAPRENLIRIDYTDTRPERAAQIAQYFVERFIADSRAMQMRESEGAFEFIRGQAEHYAAELAAAEAALEAWRAAHPEARMEPTALIEARIALLRRRVEGDQLALQGLARGDVSAASAPAPAADPTSLRIAALREELVGKQLAYTDAHPDVLRLRHQLDEMLARQAAAPPASPRNGARSAASGALALGARIAATEQEIAREIERVTLAGNPSLEYAQHVRERDVARDLYQDLLRRLEYARLSVRLDEQGSGLGFQIQEAASVPTQAVGMRFAHFVGGGLLAASLMPLALLLLYVRVDPRLRSAAALQRDTGLAVIATSPTYRNRADLARFAYQRRVALWAVALSVLAVASASLWKLVVAA